MHCGNRSPISRAALIALASVVTTVFASAAARAQSPEHDAAYQTVTRLFDAMRARDTVAMRAAFVPNASMQTLTPNGVRFEPIDGWIKSVAGAPAGLLLDERLGDPVVHVDADLASIWVEYWFFAGDRLSHCGVDAILLARQGGAWKVYSVVDTRRTQGCAPAPPKSPA